jgi:riboflavin kinase/FMN adenylyltransferase
MRLLHSFDDIDITQVRPSVVTVGAFDGVHLGHQQLIRTVVNQAHATGLQSALVTFFPNPRVVLGRAPAKYLTLPDEKADVMATLGVDVMVVHTFTQATVQTPADQFVQWMVARLGMRSLWIGPDFAMGYKRQGNAHYLMAQGAAHGFAVNVMPEVSLGATQISSTRVRDALARGDIRDANLCLGRAFSVPADYDGAHGLCASTLHLLPAPGVYPVLIEGEPNAVTITSSPCAFSVRDVLSGEKRAVTVAFV